MDKSKNYFLEIFFLGLAIACFLLWWVYNRPTQKVVSEWVYFLPYLNCFFNGLTTTFLILGRMAIGKRKKEQHKRWMLSAVGSSILFLLSYLTYHYFHGDTPFNGIGPIRIFYFIILVSHIAFSIIQIPLILITLFLAYKKNWIYHKCLAQITFPIWLFVSVSGILIFSFLKIYN